MLSEWSGKISRPRNERNIKLHCAKLVINLGRFSRGNALKPSTDLKTEYNPVNANPLAIRRQFAGRFKDRI